MDVMQAIETRRSVSRLKPEAPPRELIERLLGAAVMAPNHRETQPWRFYVLSGRARDDLGEALAAALRRRMAGTEAEKLEALSAGEKTKPLRAPVLIVVACKRQPEVRAVPIEDEWACAAAIENMLLAAHNLGLAAQWRAGDGVYDADVKAHFGLDPEDVIAGIVYLGFPAEGHEQFAKPRRRTYADRTEWRTGG